MGQTPDKPPVSRSYWVVPGKILAGPYPGAPSKPELDIRRLELLVEAGVRTIVNLQQYHERRAGKEYPDYADALRTIAEARDIKVNVVRHPVPDATVPTVATMRSILASIGKGVADGVVYVHCMGGHGRAATVAGCWLVENGMPGAAALAAIKEARSHERYLAEHASPETPAQREFVLTWEPTMGIKNPVPAAAEAASRCMGAIVGLAIGDAMGAPVEFCPRGSFEPVTGFRGGGPWKLEAGYWTDDTSLALCLAESLAECGGFDPLDQIGRYRRWWRDGHLSSIDRCFDIGGQTAAALREHEQTGKAYCGPSGNENSSNGSLMRLAPVAVYYHRHPAVAVALAGESSRTTHGSRPCVDACRYLAALLVGAVHGEPRARLLAPMYSPVPGLWDSAALCPEVAEVANGSYRKMSEKDLHGTGRAVACLGAALWAFAATDNFEAAVLKAVNLGDDADTVGAVCGQIAGACYGLEGVPRKLRDGLVKADIVMRLAERTVRVPHRESSGPR